MRIFSLALAMLSIAAGCRVNPPSGNAQGQTERPRVSVQFYLVREELGENVVGAKVESTGEIILIKKNPDLTERDISWAKMETVRGTGRPSVLVYFTPRGRDTLELLTSQNIGKRLAIAVNGKIISIPLIRTTIRGGSASIQGFESAAEAKGVAEALARR